MSGGSKGSCRKSGFRFPPERRVRKRSEYLRIQAAGRRVTTPSYVILVMARQDDGPARLGIVATRRFGGATLRNRAKRLVREAFRQNPELFPPGADLVIIVRGRAHEIGLVEAVAEFRKAAPVIARRLEQSRSS